MNGHASSTTLSDLRCPICGAMHPRKAGAAHNRSFACPRCHTVLEVTKPRSPQSLTALAASVVVALSLSIAMGLHGPGFALSLMGATAAFNCLGQLMRKVVAARELRVRPNAQAKGLPKNVLAGLRKRRSAARKNPETNTF